jgi:type IV secretory pathway VirB10-like protein
MTRHNRALAMLAVLLPAACSAPDYTPVRNWAESASLAVAYPAGVTSLRLRAAPDGPLAAPDAAPAPPPAPAPAPAPAPTARRARAAAAPPPPPPPPLPPTPSVEPVSDDAGLAMQDALVTYLVALATLSGDGVLTWRLNPMVELAERIRPRDPAAADAAVTLGAQLRHATFDVYRAPEMRGALVDANPSLQRILTALTEAVAARDAEEAPARAAVAASYQAMEREAAPGPARQAARDFAQLRDQEFADLATARAYYQALLRLLSDSHAMLTRRAPRMLSDDATLEIRQAEDAMRRAQASLPRGLGVPPPPPPPRPPTPPPQRGWWPF